ncbi:MAG: site-2 protease family protein, partial [Coriobacteriales bacterium]|nr:site-2 protease family protein [Coriobacteriales bacterium]
GLSALGYYIWYFGSYFTMINLCLALFNLIPTPPLDGASLLALFLPRSAMPTYYKIQQYSMFFFLLVVLLIPYMIGFDIFGIYLKATDGNISSFLLTL